MIGATNILTRFPVRQQFVTAVVPGSGGAVANIGLYVKGPNASPGYSDPRPCKPSLNLKVCIFLNTLDQLPVNPTSNRTQ